jgi:hypothetical protein
MYLFIYNPPFTVVSGISMDTLSQIYINQSEIESTLQNNQSENRFLRVFGVVWSTLKKNIGPYI